MKLKLTRYWFEFVITDEDLRRYQHYGGLGYGCGVTAYTYEDALAVLADKLFQGEPIPPVRMLIEDVDVSTLDAGHVLPNMGVPAWRGVWFPCLNV